MEDRWDLHQDHLLGGLQLLDHLRRCLFLEKLDLQYLLLVILRRLEMRTHLLIRMRRCHFRKISSL